MKNDFIATPHPNKFWNPFSGSIVDVKPVGYDKTKPVYGNTAFDEAPKIWEACEVISETPIHGYQEGGLYPYVRTYRHPETGATYETQIYK